MGRDGIRRRTVLAGAAGFPTILAGCIGDDGGAEGKENTGLDTKKNDNNETNGADGEVDGYIQPTNDPPTVPPSLECDIPDMTRWGGPVDDDVHLGENSGDEPIFALRTVQQTYEYDDILEIHLVNLSDETRTVGIQDWFYLQLKTEAGWEDVRVADDDVMFFYPDIGFIMDPGESRVWEIELTEMGILNASYQGDNMAICPELQAARYRFVHEAQDFLSVQFDLIAV